MRCKCREEVAPRWQDPGDNPVLAAGRWIGGAPEDPHRGHFHAACGAFEGHTLQGGRWLHGRSGKFIIGSPQGDAGLTGQKIIINTYGGWGAHGGGAFCGKDPTKVDRSAAYICRQMAKSIVKSGLCKRALVLLSYAIGVAKPLSLFVEIYGTEQLTSTSTSCMITLTHLACYR